MSKVKVAPGGAKYVTEPRVSIVGRTDFDPDCALKDLYEAFGQDAAGVNDYGSLGCGDNPNPASTHLTQFAGQLCYASFGTNRTPLSKNKDYIERIFKAGHGSVLEHTSYSILMFGVDRAMTHELVRHRAGTAYCLTGCTLIYSERGATAGHKLRTGAKKRSLKSLFEMTQSHHGRSRLKLLRLRVLDETSGTFVRGKVKAVVCSGEKPVFKVTLQDGRTITSTKEHRFLTADGWSSLSDIVGGLSVVGELATYRHLDTPIKVNGVEAYKDRAWLDEQYNQNNLSHEAIGALAGISKHTVRAWVRKFDLQKPPGSWTKGAEPWNKGLMYKTGPFHTEEAKQLFRQAKLGSNNPMWKGGVTPARKKIAQDCNKLRSAVYARDQHTCRLCRHPSGKLILHHVLPVWYRPDLATTESNLVTVCQDCHENRINNHELDFVEHFGIPLSELPPGLSRKTGVGNRMHARSMKIKHIEYAGVQMTYDIEMDGPNHNFVANGIVTHNSQVSQRYVDDTHLRFVLPHEYNGHDKLTALFEVDIDRALESYRLKSDLLREVLPKREDETATDYRKRIQSCSRETLPNCTEAPIIVTANTRAWRHIISMRTSPHADVRIRVPMIAVLRELQFVSRNHFGDFVISRLPDGSESSESPYPKV